MGFSAVAWAKQQGIYEHPSWYPGLTHESSFEIFQASFHSSGHGNCPEPCEAKSTSSQEPQVCHTAAEGETCFSAVVWAKQQGIYEQASWYPGLSADSTFEAFQAYLHSINHGSCPEPCEATLVLMESVGLQAMAHSEEQACHSAVPGEECFGHVTWAMQQGIYEHPSWYPGLTNESSFEIFQAKVHSDGLGNCPQPCEADSTSSQEPQACHTAEEGETCFSAVVWAKQQGIYEHPSWYPGLSADSTFEAFQAYLHSINHGSCPEPCEATLVLMESVGLQAMAHSEEQACHSAVPGEECFGHVTWAMQQGIYEHPSWYPGLTNESSFEIFQAKVHSDGLGN